MPAVGDPIVLNLASGYRVATSTYTSDSSTFTTSTTEVMSVTGSLISGVTYRVVAEFNLDATVSTDVGVARLIEDSTAGTNIDQARVPLGGSSGGSGVKVMLTAEYTASSTGSKTFVVTGERNSGTGTWRRESSSNNVGKLYISVR